MKKKIVAIYLTAAVACDQIMYDRIYKAIIQEALASKLSESKTMKIRNDTIENLRKLCKGQRSSYELDNPTSTRRKD